MRRWAYYTALSLLDLLRLRSTVQIHVIIVAGICLPILVLLALKRGHVEELRRDLLTSPTGRQVVFWAAQRGRFLRPGDVERMRQELGRVDLIIPVIQRVAEIEHTNRGGSRHSVSGATFESTRPGDPILEKLGVDVLRPLEKGIVLGKTLSEKLEADVGDEVTLTVARAGDGETEKASVTMTVRGVVRAGGQGGNIGYLDIGILDMIERYVQGGRVEEFNWPASRAQARDTYAEYLLFSEVELQPGDLRIFGNRGYLIEKVEDQSTRSLLGLLKPDKLAKLTVYRVFSSFSRGDPEHRLAVKARDISRMTIVDDVAIPWNPPATYKVGGVEHRLVGLSLPDPIWLKEYFHDPKIPFDYGVAERSVLVLGGPARKDPLPVEVDARVRLMATPVPPGPWKPDAGLAGAGAPLAIVPIEFLAHLDAYRHGTIEYDRINDLFVPRIPEPSYDKCRLYATTIDDVVPVVDALARQEYAYSAAYARVREIHGQDASLQLLVVIVGSAVFAFGVVTVVSVLIDSTDRKRGSMGILRVMGISRIGVFYLVFVRAIVIGLLAGLLSAALGYLLSWVLAWRPEAAWLAAWKPFVHAIIRREDLILIFVGSLTCCVAGSLYPAWRASRLDPFEAIVEGRFR